ncbi:hypothetical protein AVEN_165819-1 [Araneus ventricosus]|uniref:Uncharacterized protein n=1 Tax=Araneus ventricosus TaxID=182803 RepID=A0A4Y2EM05_ARAVE|nr:hypothetical protein AVEN_165819-1 [Araneus ventricosus]
MIESVEGICSLSLLSEPSLFYENPLTEFRGSAYRFLLFILFFRESFPEESGGRFCLVLENVDPINARVLVARCCTDAIVSLEFPAYYLVRRKLTIWIAPRRWHNFVTSRAGLGIWEEKEICVMSLVRCGLQKWAALS